MQTDFPTPNTRPDWFAFARDLYQSHYAKAVPEADAEPATVATAATTAFDDTLPPFWDGYEDVPDAVKEATPVIPDAEWLAASLAQTAWKHSLTIDIPAALACAYLAQCLQNIAAFEAAMTPGAITTLILPQQPLLAQAKKTLQLKIQSIRRANPDRWQSTQLQPPVEVICQSEDLGKSRTNLSQELNAALSSKVPIVILLSEPTALQHPLAGALPAPLSAAQNKDAMIFALDLAFGPLEALDEAALQQDLPTDANLTILTPEAIALAFRAQTALEVAKTLNRLILRGQEAGPTGESHDDDGLAELEGMGALYDVATSIARDMSDYKSKQLPWSELPRGLLLFGGPGTGKTYAAGCIARAAGVPLIAATVGGWQANGHLGDMLKAMHASFNEARAKAPCILFIDELDSFGSRKTQDTHNKNYSAQVINEMLAQIDGIAALEGVMLIGATNHPEAIDPAITRPGRFDRHVALPLPGPKALAAQLKKHLGADADKMDLPSLVTAARGKTPAQIASILRLARSEARNLRRPLLAEDILSRLAPPTASRSQDRVASVHEAGHALIAHCLCVGEPTELKIDADGGLTSLKRTPRTGTLSDLEDMLAYHFGGRAAEALIFRDVTAGSGGSFDSDIAKATDLATKIERSFGLGLNGLLYELTPPTGGRALNPAERLSIAQRLNEAEARANSILAAHHKNLTALADALLRYRHLQRDEIANFLPVKIETPATLPLEDTKNQKERSQKPIHQSLQKQKTKTKDQTALGTSEHPLVQPLP